MSSYLKKAAPVVMPCVNLGPPHLGWRSHLVQWAEMRLFSLSLFSYEGGM